MVSELLTPEKIQKELTAANDAVAREVDPDIQRAYLQIAHICRDYLTLWDELQNERSISDRLMERVAELEKLLADLEVQVIDYATQVRDLESLLDAEGIYRGEPID